MANQPGNGRNDQNRWRSDDDERFMQRERERSGASWDDRSGHSWDRDDDRSVGWRSIDRGGMGQSGYGSGREVDMDRERDRGRWDNDMHNRSWEHDMRSRPWGNNMGHSGREQYRYDEQRRSRYDHNQGQNMYGNTAYGPGYFDPHRTASGHGYGYEQPRDMRGYGHQEWRGDWRPEDQEHHESLGQRIKGWLTGHRGKGPIGYQRSDERIRETVCEALSDDDRIDASAIEVTVKNGEVTLSGTVEDRRTKRMAEDCIDNLSGVKDVQNNIRVVQSDRRMETSSSTSPTTVGNGADKRHRA